MLWVLSLKGQEVRRFPRRWFSLKTRGLRDQIWQEAQKHKRVCAIFTEASFPNKLAKLAEKSQHHTPQSLGREISKMPKKGQIFLGHLKPAYEKELKRQIQQIGCDRITILDSTNRSFHF